MPYKSFSFYTDDAFATGFSVNCRPRCTCDLLKYQGKGEFQVTLQKDLFLLDGCCMVGTHDTPIKGTNLLTYETYETGESCTMNPRAIIRRSSLYIVQALHRLHCLEKHQGLY